MRVHLFTSEEFSNLKEQWESLLVQSGADPLFLSWHWMHNWWQVYSNKCNDELLLIGVYNEQNKLEGLAPLYISKITIKKIFHSNVIQFIGTRVYEDAGFRSEYLQFLAIPDRAEQIILLILDFIAQNKNVTKLFLTNLLTDSETHTQLARYGYYNRMLSEDRTYGIDVNTDFEKYLKQLGQSSRLKLYNRRGLLHSLGEVRVELIDNSYLSQSLKYLSLFHRSRWGREISYDRHEQHIVKLVAESDILVSGVQIYLNNEIIGCTLDLTRCGNSYNFQLGFSQNVHKKISMGTLTLGYAIEANFENTDIHYFDLLAGNGKNSNYKKHLAGGGNNLINLQLLGPGLLNSLLKIRDFLD